MTTSPVLARPVPSDTDPLDAGAALSIQDAARLTGVPAHTLRWYERVGLLPGIPRSTTGRRRFTRGNLEWITVLRVLRGTGMPIATLQRLTEHHHADDRERPVRLVRTHRALVLTLIGRLQHSLRALETVERHLQRPPAVEVVGDRCVGGAGSGPRHR